MDMLKRHAFILALAAGVFVISLAGVLTVWLAYVKSNADMRRILTGTGRKAGEMMSGKIFTAEQVKQMKDQVARRQAQYEELLKFIRDLGAKRVPLVKGLFPDSRDDALRHSFKAEYDKAVDKFMKRLRATNPAPLPEAKADQQTVIEANRQAAMYADAKRSFFRPDWIDKPEAPDLVLCRNGQENLWLMEDIVDVIARMNDDIAKGKNITEAPVKELIEIRIGGDHAILPGAKMQVISGRYRPTAAAASAAAGGRAALGGPVRAATLSGRFSQKKFYQVLPFRMTVVVDARYPGEFIRRLKGHETFLSVEAWRVRPITEAQFDKATTAVMAPLRQDYGRQAVVRLEIVAESLVFELEGGRVTTPIERKAPAAGKEAKEAAAKTE